MNFSNLQDFAGYFPISGQMTTHFQILAERKAAGLKPPEVDLDEYAPIRLAHPEVPPLYLLVGDSSLEWPARVEENQLLAARLRRIYRNWYVKIYAFPSFNHNTVVQPSVAVINIELQKNAKKK